MRNLLLAAMIAGVSGCAHVSRIDVLADRYRGDLEAVKAAEGLEAASPQGAESRYREILGRVVIYKPQSDYRREFATDMTNAANESATATLPNGFTEDSPLALASVYDAAVETQARAQLGLARLGLTRGDLAGAESWARKARDLAARRALSPVTAAGLQASAGDLLAASYRKRGQTGKAELATLDAALARAYLASKAAAEAQAADSEAESRDATAMARINEIVDRINGDRDQQLAEIYAEAFGTAARMASTYRQFRIGAVRGGGAAWTQATRMAFALERQAAGASSGDPVEAALGAFANPIMGRQLSDPDFGAQAPSLIKAAATQIARLSGSEAVRSGADAVGAAVNDVVSARGRARRGGGARGARAGPGARALRPILPAAPGRRPGPHGGRLESMRRVLSLAGLVAALAPAAWGAVGSWQDVGATPASARQGVLLKVDFDTALHGYTLFGHDLYFLRPDDPPDAGDEVFPLHKSQYCSVPSQWSTAGKYHMNRFPDDLVLVPLRPGRYSGIEIAVWFHPTVGPTNGHALRVRAPEPLGTFDVRPGQLTVLGELEVKVSMGSEISISAAGSDAAAVKLEVLDEALSRPEAETRGWAGLLGAAREETRAQAAAAKSARR